MDRLSRNKKIYFFSIISLIIMSFAFGHYSQAGVIKQAIDMTVGTIAEIIVTIGGYIMSKVISLVIDFANYNSFVNNPQIIEAWKIVRDMCNMFFILILLIIAFATILRIESYNMKKWLPKLLIMAVLINFSRMICGVLIDFSQIVMLTFVAAFTNAKGNFHAVLQIDAFLDMVSDNKKTPDAASTAIAYGIAIIFIIVSTVVMLAVLVVFVMRIVMLWIYIVLSPLAFLLSSFPGGQRYASQYWGEFTRYLLNGPILAFFVWLSLLVLANLNVSNWETSYEEAPGGVAILQSDNFISFVLAIGMLVGGLIISQQIGGTGASWGAGAIKGLQSRGMVLGKKGTDWARKKTGVSGGAAAAAALSGGMTIPLAAGAAVGGAAASRLVGAGLRKGPLKDTFVGKIAQDREDKRRKKGAQKWQNRMEKMGMGEGTMTKISNWYDRSGLTGGKKFKDASLSRIIPGVTTVKDIGAASQKATSDLQNANKEADKAASASGETWAKNMKPEEWMPSSGISKKRKLFLDNMRTNPDGAAHIKSAVDSLTPGNSEDMAKLNSIAELLAAYQSKAGGGTIDGELDQVKSAVNGKVTKKVDDYDDDELMVNYMTIDKEKDSADQMIIEEARKATGDRKMRAGGFGGEKSNMIQVDLDKLNIKELLPKGHEDFSRTAGMNIENPAQIAKIANNLLGMVNSRIGDLKGKGMDKLSGAEKAELNGLEGAQKRLSNPANIQNLQLVNSAMDKKVRNEAVAHEIKHGSGVRDEGTVDGFAKQVVGHKARLVDARKASLARNKSPQDIVAKEKQDEAAVTEEKEGEETVKRTVEENVEMKNDSATMASFMVMSDPVTQMNLRNLNYSLIRMLKALNAQGGAFGKLGGIIMKMTKLADDDKSSPLEVDLETNITNKILEAQKEGEQT